MNPLLDDFQRAAATHPAAWLRIDAGPGAGKTAVLAERIAHFLTSYRAKPSEIVALTFTRAMATDLRRRVAAAVPADLPCPACNGAGTFPAEHDGATGWACGACAGVGAFSVGSLTIGTLHGLAAKWVRQALVGSLAGGGAVLDLGWVRDDRFSIAMPEDVDDMVDLAQQNVGRKKITKALLHEGLALSGPALREWPKAAEARRLLWQRNLVTYDDLLTMLEALLGASPRTGERTLAELCPCVFVDEQQDLSARHWSILGRWVGDHKTSKFTYVGDDAQAIYGFLGRRDGHGTADEMRARFDASASVVELRRNYRSGADLVSALDGVRGALAARGGCSDMPLEATKPGGRVWVASDQGGAAAVDAISAQVFDADAPEHVAVLAATWAELDELEAQLRMVGILTARIERSHARWKTIVGRALVAMARIADMGRVTGYDARIVFDALGRDRVGVDRAEDRAFDEGALLADMLDGLTIGMVGGGADWWAAVAGARSAVAVAALARRMMPYVGNAANEAANELTEWARELEAAEDRDVTPRDWLLWLASSEQVSAVRETPGAVTLSTIHGAKGLEWPAVVVTGACEGGIPPPWAKTTADRLEWWRALYVAVSRARESLVVLHPAELRGRPRHPAELLVAAGLAAPNPDVHGD